MNFELIKTEVDGDKALIYMWEIYDLTGVLVGRYVGKAKNGSKRPLRHYTRNVERLLSGKPYRKSKPEGYRQVHRALAAAVRAEYTIQLSFLTNVDNINSINTIESALIAEKNCKGAEDWQLNG